MWTVTCSRFVEFVILLSFSAICDGIYLTEPQDMTHTQGWSAVRLECKIADLDLHTNVVSWTKNSVVISQNYFIKADAVTDDEFSRYKVAGDVTRSEYNLLITNVDFSDDGEYQCIVTTVDGGVLSRSRTGSLDVILPSSAQPICSIEPSIEPFRTPVQMGEQYQIKCESESGDTPVDLVFIDINDNRPNTEITFDGLRTRITSTWKVDRFHNPMTFTCLATHPAHPVPRSCSIGPFNVQYPPFVNLSTNTTEVGVGDHVTFTCEVDANPPLYDYLWTFNDIRLDHTYDRIYTIGSRFDVRGGPNGVSILTINDVAITDNNAIISCEVRHPFGIKSKSLSLNVTATVTVSMAYYVVENGQNTMAFFTCDSQSNLPFRKYNWYYNGVTINSSQSKYKLLQEDSLLLITDLSQEDHLATVKCEVTNGVTTAESAIVLKIENSTLSHTRQQTCDGLDRTTTIALTFVGGLFAGVIILCLVQYIIWTQTKLLQPLIARTNRSSKRNSSQQDNTLNIQPTSINNLNRESRNSDFYLNMTCGETDSMGYMVPIDEGAIGLEHDNRSTLSRSTTTRGRPYTDINSSTLEPDHDYQKLKHNLREKGPVAKKVELFEYDLATK